MEETEGSYLPYLRCEWQKETTACGLLWKCL